MNEVKNNTLIRYSKEVLGTELDCLITWIGINECVSYWSDGWISEPYYGSKNLDTKKATLVGYLTEEEALVWKMKHAI